MPVAPCKHSGQLHRAVKSVRPATNTHLTEFFGDKQPSPTWGKVHCSVKTLKSSASQVELAGTVCCEEHHLIPEVLAKELEKGTQIVVVASEVAPVLILHLHSKSESVEQQPISACI